MTEEWAKEKAQAIITWHSDKPAPLLEADITQALLSAEKRGYARGVEDAAKVAHGYLERCPLGVEPLAPWGNRRLAASEIEDEIRKLLPAPEGK